VLYGLGMTGTPEAADRARRIAADVRALLEWAQAQPDPTRNEIVALVQDVLGAAGVRHSVVRRELPPFEHVNLQTALNEWSVAPGRTVEVRGVALPPHYEAPSLQQLVAAEMLPPIRLAAPAMVDLPNGPDTTLACIRLALFIVSDGAGRYVLQLVGPSEHNGGLAVEIAGLPLANAQEVLAELDRLRALRNVYRGQLIDVGPDPRSGGVTLSFAPVPDLVRADVVLPEQLLARIERHALSVSAHREALLTAGQHLKRGLLLYGPPGTGKTHTMRYLLGRLSGYTRFVLTGRALHVIGSVAELARELQPATVVLEDVDVVAAERTFSPGGSPVLFDLLDAMDGAAPDADVLFLLTTNRADLLEPALAARPGRVDVAAEISLPDAEARARLLRLYSRSVPLEITDADWDDVVTRTEGVTASFIKELLRRAILVALDEKPTSRVAVTGRQLVLALDDLLDGTQAVTRTLLGVGVEPSNVGAMSTSGPLPSYAPYPTVYPGHGPGPGPGWSTRRRRP
jgi:ATPase family associated with various cellular activities (AAA)